MHLSCTDLTRETAEAVLADAAQAGIRGLMILRGDPPADRNGGWQPIEDGFRTPADLVAFVRQRFGDRFSIAVAGHPSGHPDHTAAPRDAQIQYLRAKVLPRSRLSPVDGFPPMRFRGRQRMLDIDEFRATERSVATTQPSTAPALAAGAPRIPGGARVRGALKAGGGWRGRWTAGRTWW